MNRKDELLEQAKQLTNITRKPRSDKGQTRQPYQTSAARQPSPMTKYKRVLSRMLSKSAETNDSLLVSTDENGYYTDIPKTLSQEHGEFTYNTLSKIGRVRHVKYSCHQTPVSLERYRFNAWQYMAQTAPSDKVPLPYADLTRWALDCAGFTVEEAKKYFEKRAFTWLQLFCVFYHVQEEEAYAWTYEDWQACYARCPAEELDEEFKFIFGILPGTPGFMPQWAYVQEEKEHAKAIEQDVEKNKKSWLAKAFNRR